MMLFCYLMLVPEVQVEDFVLYKVVYGVLMESGYDL